MLLLFALAASADTCDWGTPVEAAELGGVAPESSGLVASRERPGWWLTHDDKGYPVDFDADGKPVYDPANDANVFFGPILDEVRDYRVEQIAESVYNILENLGYAKLAG